MGWNKGPGGFGNSAKAGKGIPKPKSSEHRKKISETLKRKRIKPPSQIGVRQSHETINKRIQKLRGKTPWNKGLTKSDPRVAKNYKKKEEKNESMGK
jgi:hypothetical protein